MVDESRGERIIGLVITATAPFLTLLGILVGVHQFNSQQAENLRIEQTNRKYNDAIEFKRRFWEEQKQVYEKVAELTGIITADETSNKQRDTAFAQFNILYYGKTTFVEDSTVGMALHDFSASFHDYKDGFIDLVGLKEKGLQLVSACKVSSKTTWDDLGISTVKTEPAGDTFVDRIFHHSRVKHDDTK